VTWRTNGALINFGDLPPYLTYDKKDKETVVKDNKFKYFRYLAEARAAGIVG
jgi:hypothetical protein